MTRSASGVGNFCRQVKDAETSAVAFSPLMLALARSASFFIESSSMPECIRILRSAELRPSILNLNVKHVPVTLVLPRRGLCSRPPGLHDGFLSFKDDVGNCDVSRKAYLILKIHDSNHKSRMYHQTVRRTSRTSKLMI